MGVCRWFAAGCLGLGLLGISFTAVPAAPAVSAPVTVAVTAVGGWPCLVRVDPQTLKPASADACIHTVMAPTSFALSPGGTRLAVPVGDQIEILDTASGRVIRVIQNNGFAVGSLYWFGGERSEWYLVAVGDSEFGYEYTVVWPNGASGTSVDTEMEPVASLLAGLVTSYGLGYFEVYSTDPVQSYAVDRALSGTAHLVADVYHDRLFVVTTTGDVARVDLDSARTSYHHVALSGRPFQAIWAGRGRIALWGADGLGIIDTRTWTSRALLPDATGAAATPDGLVAWHKNATTGLDVWLNSTGKHLRILAGKPVRGVQAYGHYAYAHTTNRTYSVDLRTGHVRGPYARLARIVLPTLVLVP